ncbi:hypothetical protein CVT24_005483 [Panaeolus cyanescens]|uniref:Tyr recombinase domain-containing protein n=1 Tax=Panaeolus cyanescens TaxID=181874 RepID=A0A409WTG8_9AGAR|nr:hypothetical protein CVT24_005483 [Panaeolus cyanescens]
MLKPIVEFLKQTISKTLCLTCFRLADENTVSKPRTHGSKAEQVAIEREDAQTRTPPKEAITKEGVSTAGLYLHRREVAAATQRAERDQESRESNPSLFAKEQQKKPADLHAPSASVGSATTPTNASISSSGTGPTEPTAEKRTESWSTRRARTSAQTGKPEQDAMPQTTTRSTSAQAAENRLMELRHALELRRSKPVTPYHADAWERRLREAGLVEAYKDVPAGLRQGFWAGIPQIHQVFTPPNKSSIIDHGEAFQKIMDTEFSKERYIGPVSRQEAESLLGPFQSSPLHIIPKAGRAGRFRLIQNLSYPHKPSRSPEGREIKSINSQISSESFPCTWGTFETVSLTISRLPPGSQAAVRDIKEAYRTIPLHPSQWPGIVVRINEEDFAIDTQDCFGLGSGAGVFGRVADAGAQLVRRSGMGPLSKWVDDYIFFRIRRLLLDSYNRQRKECAREIQAEGGQLQDGGRLWFRGKQQPDGQVEEFDEDVTAILRDLSGSSPRSTEDQLFAYNMDDVDRLFEELGIEVEKEKDTHFQNVVPYLGFLWDLEQKTVTLQPKKGEKYLSAIKEWNGRQSHSLEDVQKLYGKLLHTANVIPKGRAYLTSLEAFMALFDNKPHSVRKPPKHAASDLQWWAARLREAPSRSLARTTEVRNLQAFSDASSETGIGITIGHRWRAWRLLPGWKAQKRDIGWAEAVGFLLLVQTIVHLGSEAWAKGDCIQVFGDNRGVVEERSTKLERPTVCAFTPATSGVEKIQQMSHPGESTEQHNTFYLKSQSQKTSPPSLPTLTNPSQLLSIMQAREPRPQEQSQPRKRSGNDQVQETRTSAKKLKIEVHLQAASNPPPRSLSATADSSITPTQPTQQLRPPNTKARDRLRLWRPLSARNQLDSNGCPTNLTSADLEGIAESIQQAWAPSTRETYGTGLYAFHLYCNEKGIPEHQRAPASGVLISSFAASLVGLYAGSTARNYILGVLKREKRDPFTVEYMVQLKTKLDMADPLHAAVWACLTTVFWGAARLGEFTVKTLKSFDPALHITVTDVRDEVDKQGRKLKVFRIPRTKAAVTGEDVSWSKQNNGADPEAAWENHVRLNAPPHDAPLFAYREDTAQKVKHKALTKNKFLAVLKEAASQAKLQPLQGHGIRIGATLEYLLRGVPFEVMKVKGRWASDAFLTYLREHAQILAPYMQDNPAQNEEFLRLVTPPAIRR